MRETVHVMRAQRNTVYPDLYFYLRHGGFASRHFTASSVCYGEFTPVMSGGRLIQLNEKAYEMNDQFESV